MPNTLSGKAQAVLGPVTAAVLQGAYSTARAAYRTSDAEQSLTLVAK